MFRKCLVTWGDKLETMIFLCEIVKSQEMQYRCVQLHGEGKLERKQKISDFLWK